jgi:hypothetical protein
MSTGVIGDEVSVRQVHEITEWTGYSGFTLENFRPRPLCVGAIAGLSPVAALGSEWADGHSVWFGTISFPFCCKSGAIKTPLS